MHARAKITAKNPYLKRENLVLREQKPYYSQSLNSPIDHILFLQRTIGNQAVDRLMKKSMVNSQESPLIIQAKLRISQPDDMYEQEADRIAENVMRMPEPEVRRQPEEEETLRTKDVSGQTPGNTSNLESRIQSTRGGGQPLPESVQNFFKPSFSRDFSNVRVHTDGNAIQMNRELNAQAFTFGKDIYFGAGRYSPGTSSGRKLLAHELTHVVQQDKSHHGISKLPPYFIGFHPAGTYIQFSKKSRHCKGAKNFPTQEDCKKPDSAGKKGEAGWWKLIAKIDVDVPELEDIYGPEDVGHVYVKFEDSTGATWTYGFYPKGNLLIERSLEVPGLVVHPDTGHDKCVDYNETFSPTKEEFNTSLLYAQKLCKNPPAYDVNNYTCTTFVREVVKKAGKNLPSGKGVLKRYYYLVIKSDWPNVVLEALRKRDELLKEKKKRGE